MPLRWNWSISCTSGSSRYVLDEDDASNVVGDSSHRHQKARRQEEVVTKTSSYNSNGNSTTATQSLSSNSSGDSSSSDRHVTFRSKEKRVPKSVNASSHPPTESSSYIPSPRGSSEGGSWDPNGASAFSPVVPLLSNGDSFASQNLLPRAVVSSSTDDEVASLCAKRVLSPRYPHKVNFLYDKHNTAQDSDATNTKEGNEATSDMFTKDDIDAITPLQISTYLTMKEREEIGTKILYSNLSNKGARNGVVIEMANGEDELCKTCSMPRLMMGCASGEMVEIPCPVCPELKRRVLERILDGCC